MNSGVLKETNGTQENTKMVINMPREVQNWNIKILYEAMVHNRCQKSVLLLKYEAITK